MIELRLYQPTDQGRHPCSGHVTLRCHRPLNQEVIHNPQGLLPLPIYLEKNQP